MKKFLLIPIIATLTACSGMKTVENRKEYAMPDWYQECQQAGVKGYFWWKKEFAYACGDGDSLHAQAAEEQMYAIAMNNFAKRIKSEVNSETVIDIVNDKKSTHTKISYVVKSTTIREHMRTETAQFTMQGRHYTFVRLEMPKEVFNQLIAEAKAQKQ